MDDLNVQNYGQPVNEGWLEKVKNFLTVPKIIFLVLGLIVLGELIFAAKALFFTSGSALPFVNQNSSNNQAGRISLSASQNSYKVNEVIPVTININSGGNTLSGADLVIRYDANILDIKNEDIAKGNLFDEYPLISVDATKGLIAISGINSIRKGFTGAGQFAKLNLRAKVAGKTSLAIDFQKGSTADSNLVDMNTSKDVLEAVENLDITIQ